MTNMKHTVSHSLYLIIIFAQVVEHLNKLTCLRTQKSQIQSTHIFTLNTSAKTLIILTWKFLRRKKSYLKSRSPVLNFGAAGE